MIKKPSIDQLEKWCSLGILVSCLGFAFPITRSLHELTIWVCCVIPAVLLIRKKSLALFFKNRLFLAGTIFLVYFSISALWSDNLSFRTIRRSFELLITPFFALLAGAWGIKRHSDLEKGIHWFLPLASIGAICSLIFFYLHHTFPITRFQHYYNTESNAVHSSWFMGFATILSASFFLQTRPTKTRWGFCALSAFSLFFMATLYTHTRSTIISLFGAATLFLFSGKKNTKKLITLSAVATISIGIYIASLHFASDIMEWTSTVTSPPSSKLGSVRPRGVWCNNPANANIRISTWKELVNSMSSKEFVFGKGLEAKYKFSTKINHPHSGYIWALYHGGLVGLLLFLYLLVEAFIAAIKTGKSAYIPAHLLFFGCLIYLMDGKSLVSKLRYDWLLAWIPIILITGLSYNSMSKRKGIAD